ncbi:N-acetylmuramoyl-L-alanine amidase [Ruminococcus sp. 5_1_39BFAA]|uniref:N-acetylmuramoyl-L-alanine amidase n=1 Tax=Ruminococcus sp. 5_1_39BFAA TaxID=457412 RepID=UPI00356676DF
MLKKHFMELTMACLLLICFYYLSREAANVSKEMNSEKVIVVDAGHGGMDPGMIGVGGLEEKGINLSIALKLKEELEKRDFTVVMTRSEDVGLYDKDSNNKKAQDLQKRISIIQETEPLLSVSIHQNSYQDPSVKGPQVFYYKDSIEGEKLAKILQEELNTGLSVARPRIEKGNTTYYLLKRSPGILNIIECGFLTNQEEASLLQQEEYQQQVAQAIADGISQYLDLENGNAV